SLTAADSNTFNVTVGSATQLVLTHQPASSTAGTTRAEQRLVGNEDAGRNVVTSDSTTTVNRAITSGTPTSGGPGTLSCTTNPVTASSGVATFAACKIDSAGTAYQLHASSSPSLTAADSTTFNVTVGSATQLVFTTQPGGASTGGT